MRCDAFAHLPGLDVGQDRLLGQVVPDDRRHVGIERLVVGHAGADGVGQRDVAGPVGVEQPRDPERRVGAERQRVDEVVVDAAVDHVDALRAGGGPHVDDVVVHEQVAALDQLDAHLPGQEGVFEVGGVEDARREQHDRRLGPVRRGQGPQRRQQGLAVVIDGTDVVAAEEQREHPLDHLAVGEHVAHPARHAQVVLEHRERPVGQAHQVGAGHRDVDVVAHGDALHLAAEVLAAVDQVAGMTPSASTFALP